MTAVRSVLVIDDDPQVLRTLDAICRSLGLGRVRVVSDRGAALGAIREEEFSAVICDYRLRDASGVDFVETLRDAGNETPVLFISGAPDREAVTRALRLKRTAFLGKPFTIDELRGALRDLADTA